MMTTPQRSLGENCLSARVINTVVLKQGFRWTGCDKCGYLCAKRKRGRWARRWEGVPLWNKTRVVGQLKRGES